MNKIKFLSMSLMALLMVCFTACENNKYEVDHTAELVGTWTCIRANHAEALVFNADGTVLSTGVENGEYWENVAGTYVIENDVATMIFEDGDNAKGHIDVVPGIAFTIYEEDGEEWTFNYCPEDLSDEIVGMWVCTQTPSGKSEDMLIQNFQEDGTLITTGRVPEADDYIVNADSNYKVFGDLYIIYGKEEGTALVFKFNVSSNETTLGKMMTVTGFMPTENGVVEETTSWLRVKDTLNLAGKGYYYHDVFVSNVDGEDKDIDFMGYTFNFAKMTNSELNKLLNSLLFNVEFPDANTIQYIYMYNNTKEVLEAPIVVEGNKVIIKMSAKEPALKNVVLYAFQDADCSQLHFYMSRTAFVNFHANMQAKLMKSAGQLDLNDEAAVKAIYDSIDAAVNTINVSLVFKAK